MMKAGVRIEGLDELGAGGGCMGVAPGGGSHGAMGVRVGGVRGVARGREVGFKGVGNWVAISSKGFVELCGDIVHHPGGSLRPILDLEHG